MALVKCPECKLDVSDSAETCPHCGYRLKKPDNSTRIYSQRPYYNNRASQIVERDHNMKHIGGIVAGVITIILGIVLFFFCGVPGIKEYKELLIVFILSGVVLILTGIGVIIYSAYRLNNY